MQKVVVVVGASSGIGRGAALKFAARGDDVVLAARSVSSLDEVAAQCRALGARARAVPTDVTDEAAVIELARRAAGEFGRIDAWVNAAAVWSYGTFEDTPSGVFRAVVETTLFGQVHGMRAVLPHFREQGHGVLVNVGSLYGRLASPYVSPYVTAKWGLRGLSETVRQELRDAPGIAVCAVLPGAVDTPIYRHAALYVGRPIRPLPPVLPPGRVAAVIVRVVDHPRAEVAVGRAHHWGARIHDAVPWLYDRVVGSVIDTAVLRRGAAADDDGTVFEPRPETNAVDDGWRRHDRRRNAARAGAAAALGVAGVAAARALRGRPARR